MSTSGSKSNEHVAHFLVDIHRMIQNLVSINSILARRNQHMTEFSYDNIEKSIDVLHLNLSIAELAKLSEENSLTTDHTEVIKQNG